MEEQIAQLTGEAQAAIQAADSLEALDGVRVKYLGKKGELTGILRGMGKLSAKS